MYRKGTDTKLEGNAHDHLVFTSLILLCKFWDMVPSILGNVPSEVEIVPISCVDIIVVDLIWNHPVGPGC